MVFLPDAREIFDCMKAICATHRLQGVAPSDNQTCLAGEPPGRDLSRAIAQADMSLMQSVSAGIFCLDGFRRGPEMDPGTAFEIGYMTALDKPLAAWTRDVRDYPTRVQEFFTGTFGLTLSKGAIGTAGGISGSRRDPDGVLVHSEGCFQNAMVDIAIAVSGGQVFADHDWRIAFTAAIADLAGRLRNN
jgi:nucleoside 2-deoxyribosyltransferase